MVNHVSEINHPRFTAAKYLAARFALIGFFSAARNSFRLDPGLPCQLPGVFLFSAAKGKRQVGVGPLATIVAKFTADCLRGAGILHAFFAHEDRAMTSFGRRLATELEQEFARLASEWYLAWHELARGVPIDLDDFRGGRIRLNGMRFDASAELAYWSAASRYARGKIEDTFGQAEDEIRARAGTGVQAIAEETAIHLRSFLERLHRHAVFTEYRLRARGYPDEFYLDARRDEAIADQIQRRKMTLIEHYRSLPLRRKVAMAAISLARGRVRLPLILLLGTLLAALVFLLASTSASDDARESVGATGGKLSVPLSTISFANTRLNPIQRPRG